MPAPEGGGKRGSGQFEGQGLKPHLAVFAYAALKRRSSTPGNYRSSTGKRPLFTGR